MIATIIALVQLHCADPQLTMAIIEIETDFRNVTTEEGSVGLMQVRPQTAKWLQCKATTTKQLLNPELNIKCGCKYLKKLSSRYSKQKKVIAAYNAGSAIVCKDGKLKGGKSCKIGQFINQHYVNKVTKRISRYNKDGLRRKR